MKTQPMAEVFGFPIDNLSKDAERSRRIKLCPFNNRVPNCTKDKASDPLGTCSVFQGARPVITCPVRFREDWIIAEDAAEFFFGPDTNWTSLTEVRLNDHHGVSAGNIDVVLVAYDDNGKVTEFGAIEVQAVYISGNIRTPFKTYMTDPISNSNLNWLGQANYPRPDFLSSSRKRLAPQLIYKGGILNAWNKKTAVVLDRPFFERLPRLQEVRSEEAEMAWLVYDLELDSESNRYRLVKHRTIYTQFESTLLHITRAQAGPVEDFVDRLQMRLDETLNSVSPETRTLLDQEEIEP